MTGSDDRRLADAVARRGDARAFRALYERHTPVMYGLALRLSAGAESDAEDLVHDAWIRAVERLDTFEWRSALRSWLCGFVVHRWREVRRARGREASGDPEENAAVGGRGGGTDDAGKHSATDSRLDATADRVDLERAVRRLLGALASGAGGDAGRLVVGSDRDAEPAAGAGSETSYVLLLYEGDDFRPTADEDALVAEYRGWAVDLDSTGALVSGEKLDETGTLLEAPGGDGVALPGGDHGSPLGRLGGYFVISAANRAEAVAIAGTCPHLRHGGRIVVRPIIPT